VAELPRQRFATGSAVTACFRQIGAVVGIAVLLAVVGDPTPGTALTSFHHAWWVMAATGAVAAACGVALGRVRARDSEPTTPTGPTTLTTPTAPTSARTATP